MSNVDDVLFSQPRLEHCPHPAHFQISMEETVTSPNHRGAVKTKTMRREDKWFQNCLKISAETQEKVEDIKTSHEEHSNSSILESKHRDQ